jgi:hypothetical protein
LTSSFPLDEKLDPITEYMNDVMTIPASLAGTAISFFPPARLSAVIRLATCLTSPQAFLQSLFLRDYLRGSSRSGFN